jgi:hypothetical protein
MDFNAEAFINRRDFDSDDDMIQSIIDLDQNDDKYNEMLNKPLLNPRNKVLDLNRFVDWFIANVYRGEKL